jgi:hypothetical protein
LRVGLSPRGGSDIKIQTGCNIRQLPKIVNVSFPDKAVRAAGCLSNEQAAYFGQTIAKFPQD